MSEDKLAGMGQPARARGAAPQRRGWASWLQVAMPVYFLVYLCIRIGEQGALQLDEAEIVHLTQELRLGYGTQPPLYAWLQWLLFEVCGINRFSVLLPKTLALALSIACLYRAALPLLKREGAVAAAAALMLFPQVGWEALRIQTHSVLMVTCVCATLWTFVALSRHPSLPRYVLLGVLAGLGLQTKYNYGVFLAGVAGASLLVPEYRRVVWNRRLWLAAGVALVLFLPHAAWMALHVDAAFGGTVRKLQEGAQQAPYLRRVLQGLLSIGEAGVSFVALPGLVFLASGWRWRRELQPDTQSPASRFFLAFYGICALILLGLALTGRIGTLKERWLIPILFCLPLALFILFPGLKRPTMYRRIALTAAAFSLCLLVLLPVRTWLAPRAGWLTDQHRPYTQLAAELERRCPSAQAVLTDGFLSAGNLRFARPAWHTFTLEQARRGQALRGGPAVLVTLESGWPGTRAAFHAAWPQAKVTGQGRMDLPLGLGSRATMPFAYECLAL